MRWIDRGPEPATVAGYAQQFTPDWIDYVQRKERGELAEPPEDHWWGNFRSLLGRQSNNNCWYCEQKCDTEVSAASPTVDHFRPKSKFPRLTYQWSNWVFSCKSCNRKKSDSWPETGYVDPCAADPAERPERYFEFALQTLHNQRGNERPVITIRPKSGLSPADQRKAQNTIDDLGLNRANLRRKRFRKVGQFLQELVAQPGSVAERAEQAEFAGMLKEHLSSMGVREF